MQQQKLAIPAVCSECGELFDMSYDLKKNIEEILGKAISKKSIKKSKLCWECRSLF